MPETEYDVPDYFRSTRLPSIGRYRSLIKFLRYVFRNGVTVDAIERVQSVKNDVLLEYFIALSVLKDTKGSSKYYAAARALVAHLHRCYILMEYAWGKARAYQMSDPTMTWLEFSMRQRAGGAIMVAATGIGLTLLRSLQDQTERIKAAEPEIRDRMGTLPPEVLAYWEERVKDGLNHLQQKSPDKVSVAELNQILGLQTAIEGERERVS